MLTSRPKQDWSVNVIICSVVQLAHQTMPTITSSKPFNRYLPQGILSLVLLHQESDLDMNVGDCSKLNECMGAMRHA